LILISILGDFHSSILPVLYNFKEIITKHVLVYDDAKKDVQNAKNVQTGIERFSQKYNYAFEKLDYSVDEDSVKALSECADYILSLTKNHKDIYINTTDGYSSLTTILNHKLFKKNINFIAYDMYDNEYNILSKAEFVTKKINNNLNIEDHFLLKGYKTKKSQMKDFANLHVKDIKQIFEKYSNDFDRFVALKDINHKYVKNIPDNIKIKPILVKMGLKNMLIKSPLLTGGLFECYVYLLVREMNFDDIEIGFEVFRKYKKSDIKNEFDVLVMKNNHLHVIECKFRNRIKLEELIYKYIALGRMLDEDGKIVIIAKKEPNFNAEILESRHGGLSYKRGKLSNIEILGNVHNNNQKFVTNIKNLFQI